MPLTHNDGSPVSPTEFKQTHEEVIVQFGAVSVAPHSIRGIWVHNGTRYEDESRLLIVDVDDTPENEEFFAEWKSLLCRRFGQIEIYIISYAIERH